jgi:hypothetical protein
LAKGHALLTGRNYISNEDVSIVVETVLSTAQIERVGLFDLPFFVTVTGQYPYATTPNALLPSISFNERGIRQIRTIKILAIK